MKAPPETTLPHLNLQLSPLQGLMALPSTLQPLPQLKLQSLTLMLWICLLPAGTRPPAETVGNASVVARRITWFETARFLIAVPWEFA